MRTDEVILGEFEDEVYAKIARRELIMVGIKAKVHKERNVSSAPIMLCTERVRLIVNNTQVEKARKILTARFI